MFLGKRKVAKGTKDRVMGRGRPDKDHGDTYTRGSAAWWEQQIQLAVKDRADNSFEHRWSDLSDLYNHRFGDDGQPHFNLVYLLGSSLIPSVVFNNPHVTHSARRPEFNFWAGFFDGIINWFFDEIHMKEKCEDAVLRAYIKNAAGFEVGYDYGTESTDEMVFNKIPGMVDSTRLTNRPYVDIVDPTKFILAQGTASMEACPWYGRHFTIPLRVMKEKEGIVLKNLKATEVHEATGKYKGNRWMKKEGGPKEEFVSFFVIHDVETGKVHWQDTEGNIILRPMEDSMQLDGLALKMLTFNKGTDSIWGTPDPIYIESQQTEGDECRRAGRYQRLFATLKVLAKSGVFDEEQMTQLYSGNPAPFLNITLEDNERLQDVIMLLQPHVQQEYGVYQQGLVRDAQLITGMGDNQLGVFSGGRHTKYEAQVVENRNLMGTDFRRNKLADVLGKVASSMDQYVVENWKAPHVSKVVGVEGAIHWVQASPEEFKNVAAQLVTKVNVESLRPINKEQRREEMVGLLQAIGNSGVNIMPIVQAFISTFDWADVTGMLPQAAGGVQSMDQFSRQQGQLQSSGDAAKQLPGNLAGLMQGPAQQGAASE